MSKHKNMVRLIEVYESSNHYYLILEKLVTSLEKDYTHEEIQLIMKVLSIFVIGNTRNLGTFTFHEYNSWQY
jgi:hypothetical protein